MALLAERANAGCRCGRGPEREQHQAAGRAHRTPWAERAEVVGGAGGFPCACSGAACFAWPRTFAGASAPQNIDVPPLTLNWGRNSVSGREYGLYYYPACRKHSKIQIRTRDLLASALPERRSQSKGAHARGMSFEPLLRSARHPLPVPRAHQCRSMVACSTGTARRGGPHATRRPVRTRGCRG